MRRLHAVLLLSCALVLTSCAGAPEMRMLKEAKETDPQFPDGIKTKLTQFAYIGDLRTGDGEKLRVVAARSVILGMPSPRGQAWLSFHDYSGRFIGEHQIDAGSPPLWCDGSRVYFFGLQTNGDERGNALDPSKGYAARKYLLAPTVGSWTPPD